MTKQLINDKNGLIQKPSIARSMLACLLEEHNKITLREAPIPRLSEGDILVKMEASGICGTDLEKIDGRLGPGGILGHEVSGTIQETTKTVTNYSVGDRMVAHHHVPCYNCAICRNGDFTLCNQFKKTNIDPCGLATYFRVPKYNVERGAIIPIPRQLSFEEGAMIEPTACCIRAIRRAGVREHDNILVVGLGPTGLTQVQLVRNQTHGKIFGTDVLEPRLEMGSKVGADRTLDPRTANVSEEISKQTNGGVDLAMVATGNEKALNQAFASVRKGGKILLFGAPSIGASYHIDVSKLFTRQISLISSYSCVEPEMHEAIQLVQEKKLNIRGLISDRFKLKDADKALEHAHSSKTAIKTIVTA